MANDWLIDLGHTRLKWARVSPDGELIDTGSAQADRPGELLDQLPSGSGDRLWMSAQGSSADTDQFYRLVRSAGLQLETIRTGQYPLPVAPAYSGLGCDRWLALQWPWRRSGGPVCIVDCGTALTVDVVNDEGRHLGGWIMAGPERAREGLLSRADRLAREPADPVHPERPATDTADALTAGALLQAAGAIERAVAAAAEVAGDHAEIWITGGGATAIMPLLRLDTQFDEHLVLRGLALLIDENRS